MGDPRARQRAPLAIGMRKSGEADNGQSDVQRPALHAALLRCCSCTASAYSAQATVKEQTRQVVRQRAGQRLLTPIKRKPSFAALESRFPRGRMSHRTICRTRDHRHRPVGNSSTPVVRRSPCTRAPLMGERGAAKRHALAHQCASRYVAERTASSLREAGEAMSPARPAHRDRRPGAANTRRP